MASDLIFVCGRGFGKSAAAIAWAGEEINRLRAELETAELERDEARTLVRELTDTSEEPTIHAAVERKAGRFVYAWDTGETVKRGDGRKESDV